MEKIKKEKSFKFGLFSLSQIVFLLMFFVTPFLVWQNSVHSFSNLRLGLFYGISVLGLLSWSIFKLKNNKVKVPYNLLFLSILLIIVSSLLSAIFSDNFFISFFGLQLNTLSFVSVFVLFSTSLVLSLFFGGKRSSYFATITLYGSMLLGLIVSLLYIFIDKLPNFGIFVNNSINIFGKWSDLGIISALVLIFSYLFIETITGKNLLKTIAWVGFVVSSISLIIVSETVVWFILLVISVLYLVYKVVVTKSQSLKNEKKIPYTTLVIILFSFFMILAGGLLSSFTDEYLKINFLETKPGVQATFEMTKNTLSEKPILGMGINRFERAWQLYKPDEINQTEYWGTNFNYGYSYISSLPAQSGIVGLVSWLMFVVLVIWFAVKLLFKKEDDLFSQKINTVQSFAIIYFIIVMLVHVPSTFVLLAFFMFLGLFLGSVSRAGLYKTIDVKIEDKPKTGFLFIFSIVVFMIVIIYFGYIFTRQFVSTFTLENASYKIYQGDLVSAQNQLNISINSFLTDVNMRALSEYYLIGISNLLKDGDLNNKASADAFRALLTNAINASNTAIAFDRNNYQNYVSLGDIYQQLVSLNVQSSYEESIKFYQRALEVNPKNPGIYVSMARSSFAAGENATAKDYISKALEMNPYFVDASFLLSQIQVSEGDIDGAIGSVESSINIQPNNPNLYFQLGLLRYNDSDYEGAISAFETAVILNNYFSNAKYFLGLSYERVGRTQDAIAQFEDLKILNPENREIDSLLSNLKSGALFSETEEDESEEELPIEE